MSKGLFIAFEGLDGAGQSTQVAMLADRLTNDGHKVLVTKEPTNNIVGGLIRGALTHEWKPTNQVIQLLYAADRGHHLQREILPAIEKGYIVITDRYYYSSIAFGSLDMERKWLETINQGYREPDAAFYIQVSAQVAVGRMASSRFGKELFEEEEKLAKIAKAYAELVKDHATLQAVNGERSKEEVHANVYALVQQLLQKQG